MLTVCLAIAVKTTFGVILVVGHLQEIGKRGRGYWGNRELPGLITLKRWKPTKHREGRGP